MADQNMARVVDGQAADVCLQSLLAETYHADVAAQFTPVPSNVQQGWRLTGSTWAAPPPPATPPYVPPVPASYYISKVVFQRRLPTAAFVALDALRVTVAGRPADWATNQTAPWPQFAGLVRPVLDYEAADSVNVVDPALNATLQALQASEGVFGSDPVAAQAAIALVLTPGPLPGEPA